MTQSCTYFVLTPLEPRHERASERAEKKTGLFLALAETISTFLPSMNSRASESSAYSIGKRMKIPVNISADHHAFRFGIFK